MSKWVEYKVYVDSEQDNDTYDQIVRLPGVIEVSFVDSGEY